MNLAKLKIAGLNVDRVTLDTLSPDEWVALNIYVGLKPAHRRDEFEREGLNWDEMMEALTKKGFIAKGRLQIKLKPALELFGKLFGNRLVSYSSIRDILSGKQKINYIDY